MYLQKLSVINFKNYEQADFEFSQKINCFVGNNGVGKTNLLDAIHYLSLCKSYFNPLDTQNIRHEADYFAIHGSYFLNQEFPELIQCIQKKNQRKRFLINKKEYDRLADHIGQFPLVMISPYDSDLINDGSEIRRKYMDSVISQFDKVYLDHLINYNKALFQRNSLLKSFAVNGYFDPAGIEGWNEQLIRIGEAIFEKRNIFLGEITPILRHYFSLISGGNEKVDLKYQSQLSEGNFRDKLINAISRDRAVQYSTVGIHKDDLELEINGFPIKKYGSQGQQKSFLISIKLAQFEYTRNMKGFEPTLLLDDVFDKLDDFRVSQLIKLVSEHTFGQVFITDTSENRIRAIFDAMDIEHKIFIIQPSGQTT